MDAQLVAGAALVVLVAVQVLVWRAAARTGGAGLTTAYLLHLLGVATLAVTLYRSGSRDVAAAVSVLGAAGVAGYAVAGLQHLAATASQPHEPTAPWATRHRRALHQARIAAEVAFVVAAVAVLVTVVDARLNGTFNSKADTSLCTLLHC